MTIIALSPRTLRAGPWRTQELDHLVKGFASELAHGSASDWDVAVTETGDPQFYLLGPPPDEDCILCISRLGTLYVVEDGAGHVLFEHASLAVLAEQGKRYLHGMKADLVARATALWCAIREAFEEKVEPVLVEGEELLTHLAPQLAAVA